MREHRNDEKRAVIEALKKMLRERGSLRSADPDVIALADSFKREAT